MKKLLHNYIETFRGLSEEVWWLALITLINRAGTMVIPFLSLYLTEDLEFSLTHVGSIMMCFGLGSVAGSWLGGKLTDTIGYYKVMVRSLIGTGILFIALQFLTTFYAFCLGIFLVMLVADMFRPAMFVALSAYSKPENKTRSVTLIRLAINLGFSAGPAVGGIIITTLGYSGLFWVDGITCILATVVLFKVLNPKKITVLDNVVVTNPDSAYRDKAFVIFLVAMFLFGVIFLQYYSTMPIYYREVHMLSKLDIGLLLGANGFLIFLLEMPLIKWLENSKFSKTDLMIFGALLTASSFIILNSTTWSGILIIGMFLMTIGEMIAFPFSNAFAMERAKKGNQGEYMALYSIAFSMAHIFGHKAGMQMVNDWGFDNTWYMITAIGTFCVILLLILKSHLNLKVKLLK
ncbi:MFS transporter [Algibacter amylolyticus]|uniref:MFS transporter n=1 Tax=Algibacter amylolyticus TaxID=1608400 RepID=A0A5M7B108_9FLAO|nr:MFS transporter [Algibacter amylolyticus]KAA5823386.1 MFS transporter [Algibacter amylolyticus]MBB5267534.1 putative MFS family arabinose efflux permease [Algibacter amylolyticus]TSJ73874.1 MFS transporter [Algibacter amylolyticus]